MLVISSHPERDDHDTGAEHPEQHARLIAAAKGLADAGLEGRLRRLPPRAASRQELARVHDTGYLDHVNDLAASGGGHLDPDTVVSRGSWETARFTAGGGLAAVEALQAGWGPAAFVLGRPPGHHAGRDRGAGFCLINTIAVSAAALVEAGERVAILDWDVHHGDGTQAIFAGDPRVLYVSIHQWPLYPGTGTTAERGHAAGHGTTLNLPLPPHATGDVYLALMDLVVAPVVARFAPTWLLVSAGFDAHSDDPLGDMRLTAADFAELTGRAIAMVTPGRLALFLEGGYDLAAVHDSVGACAARLLDADHDPGEVSVGGPGMGHVVRHREELLQLGWL